MLDIMKLYRKKIHLAPMRGFSWQVVEFTGKRGLYANSLSGPPKQRVELTNLHDWKIQNKGQIFIVLSPGLNIRLLESVWCLVSKYGCAEKPLKFKYFCSNMLKSKQRMREQDAIFDTDFLMRVFNKYLCFLV